jgi:hypothetical protein
VLGFRPQAELVCCRLIKTFSENHQLKKEFAYLQYAAIILNQGFMRVPETLDSHCFAVTSLSAIYITKSTRKQRTAAATIGVEMLGDIGAPMVAKN